MPPRKGFNPKNRKRAPREKPFNADTETQLAMSSRVVELLGARPGREQEVDFFFYADTRSAARRLATALKEMQYDVSFEKCPDDHPRFFIGGNTTKMKMDDRTLRLWTEKMCGLAARFHCKFDGWGTPMEMEDSSGESQ